MKTKVRQNGNQMILELSGYLDFDSSRPIEESLSALYQSEEKPSVVINLRGLEFVGSSGVSNFVKALRPFNTQTIRPRYVGVKSEFLKLFRAFEGQTPFDATTDDTP